MLSRLLVVSYLRFPALRAFPSNLVFWRTLADFGFSLQFLWTNINDLTSDGNNSVRYHILVVSVCLTCILFVCSPLHPADSSKCRGFIAFFTQFCLFASLGWYFVLALNTYVSISNPFRRPQSFMKSYHRWVWTSSFVSAVVAARQSEFRQDFQLCWIARTEGFNVFNWVLCFIWVILFTAANIAVLVYANRQLAVRGMSETLETRTKILEDTKVYVILGSLYWIVAGIIWFIVYVTDDEEAIIQVSFKYHSG